MSAQKTVNDLCVGDQVWWGDVNGKGHVWSGTVSKVGPKLVTVGGRAFRKDTGRTNDAYGHQWLIPDLDAYRDRQRAIQAFLDIRTTHGLPDGVSHADVLAAAKLLRVQLREP
jgi:hypothetical protein